MIDLNTKEKWDFEDYAFTIAGVVFAAPMIFGILINALSIESLYDTNRWWPFSWMFFMFAWAICTIKDVIDIKRGVRDVGKSLKDATEYALYICITTILLLVGIIQGQMYSSWLAGPVVFVLFMVIWPLLRNSKDGEQAYFPTIPFIILIAGIAAELVIGGWVAFPVSWVLISAIKLYETIRKYRPTEDVVVDIVYHAFSIILLSASLVWEIWAVSWLAYPIAVIIGKVVDRIRRKFA